MSDDIKLHKCWNHWCKMESLRPEGYRGYPKSRGEWAWMSLQGRGRRWRINCYGELCVSLKEEYFDRWALSQVATAPMPQSKAQFTETIAALLILAKLADAERAIYLAS